MSISDLRQAVFKIHELVRKYKSDIARYAAKAAGRLWCGVYEKTCYGLF